MAIFKRKPGATLAEYIFGNDYRNNTKKCQKISDDRTGNDGIDANADGDLSG